MDSWKFEERSFNIENVKKQESLFAQGNGYFGWRGTFEEGLDDNSLEGCYINGFFESYTVKYPEIAYGYPESGQCMLSVMNAKKICIEINNEQVSMDSLKVKEYYRVLDLKNGLLTRRFIFKASNGNEVKIEIHRFISFSRKNCGAISLMITPLNFNGKISIKSAIVMDVGNQQADKDPRVGTHLPKTCYKTIETKREGNTLLVHQQTILSKLNVACAVHHSVNNVSEVIYSKNKDLVELCYNFNDVSIGQVINFEKYISYCADTGILATALPSTIVQKEVMSAYNCGFTNLISENEKYLKEFWNCTDIIIEGDDNVQQALRFNSFHLLQATGKDGHRNVSAKGMTGHGYEGHYFWDTEIYVIPALLYTNPKICRSLLEYRFNGLPAARKRAREMGHDVGALYPWRTINGDECSTFFPAGSAQYHINGDIALAIKNYTQISNDLDFLVNYGAEILFETARLWLNLGNYSDSKGGYCINCVTGPDEYTAVVNNNFYTNMIARENLWYAYRIYEQLKSKNLECLNNLCKKINLTEEEPKKWKHMADNMYFPYDKEKKVFLQDDSFLEKKKWDFDKIPKDKYPLLLNFHPLVIYRHQVLKQADTILADFVLDQYMNKEQIQRDYDFYEPLTTHDSSLSACVYSIVASKIGYLDKAYNYFMHSIRVDLDDHNGNTKDGIHIANMAGSTMCVINGFAGIRQYESKLIFDPVLPKQWKSYSFKVIFQSNIVHIFVGDGKVELKLLEGNSLTAICKGKEIILEKDKIITSLF